MTQRVDEIFAEARTLTGDDRADYLRHACGDDIALLRRLEVLLRADSQADEFLAEPLGSRDGDDQPDPDTTRLGAAQGEFTSDWIGPYRLLQLIGEGGFGSVWMAEQREPIRRRVAVKIIKLGMDTRQVIARFEAERQALAMMEHPNIARVLDAGATAGGRPYFVMELVRGVPIVEFCDEQRLQTRERLQLFVQVCRALQHAHQKGIIHRDIKPNNVLVTLHDGEPVVKVIDFGIAKATSAELTQRTLFTEHRQMIGTPAYMSPEQAALGGLDIDTRSDIYALGVLLYELLTGTTPFDTKVLLNAGMAEMLRVIREDEPHKPSTRLSSLGQTATRTAELRRCEPQRLRSMLRGDLDWIAMRCLEKDRTRRYESANGLALDIERHLAGEPVTAAPPNAAYLARKFVRRHRFGVALASIVAALVIVAVLGTSAGLVWALHERDRADESAADALAAQQRSEASESHALEAADRAERSAYNALILAAESAIMSDRTREAQFALDATPAHQRGWEWHALRRSADSSAFRIRTPDQEVIAAQVTPDDRHVVTVNSSGTVRVFDLVSGAHLRDVETGLRKPQIVLSPSGTLLLVNERSLIHAVRAFDWPSGRLLWERTGRVGSMPFSADEQTLLLSVHDAGVVIVVDTRTGAETKRFRHSGRAPDAAGYAADGRTIYLLDSDSRTVCAIDLASGEETCWSPPIWGENPLLDVPRARLIVRDRARSQMIAYDLHTRSSVRTYVLPKEFSQPLDVSPNGRLLLLGAESGVSKSTGVLDLETGEMLGYLHGQEERLSRRFSASGRWIAAGDWNPTVRVWSTPAHAEPFRCTLLPRARVLDGAFCPSRQRLACAGWGTLCLWDALTGELLWFTGSRGHYIERVAWRPDGGLLAFAETPGHIIVVDPEDGTIVARHDGFPGHNTALAWSADGSTLLLAGDCGSLAWIDPTSGERLATIDVHDGPITAMVVSPDGSRVVATCGGHIDSSTQHRFVSRPETRPAVAIVDVRRREVVARSEALLDHPTAVAFTPCGLEVIVGDIGGNIQVFDDSLRSVRMTTTLPGQIRSLAFDASATRLAIGMWRRGAAIVDLRTGSHLLSFRESNAIVITFVDHGSGESLQIVEPIALVTHAVHPAPREIAVRRRAVADVRRLVEPLYAGHLLSADVLIELDSMRGIDQTLRTAAIEHVRRRGDDLIQLGSDLVVLARTAKYAPSTYRSALRVADHLARVEPERAHGREIHRALLYLRLGELDAAQLHLDRVASRSPLGADSRLFDLCVAALVELAHGNRGRAEELRALAEVRMASVPATDETIRPLHDEIVRLLQ